MGHPLLTTCWVTSVRSTLTSCWATQSVMASLLVTSTVPVRLVSSFCGSTTLSEALNEGAVTGTALADARMICQDFFARRWEAVARAEDFVRLLNRTEPQIGRAHV